MPRQSVIAQLSIVVMSHDHCRVMPLSMLASCSTYLSAKLPRTLISASSKHLSVSLFGYKKGAGADGWEQGDL